MNDTESRMDMGCRADRDDFDKLYCRLDTKHHDLLERILKNHEYS